MKLRTLMAIIYAVAAAVGITMLAVLISGDLELVQSITGDVEPGPEYWVFLVVGVLLVLGLSAFAWIYFVEFQAGRLRRITSFVDGISETQEAEHRGPLVPLPLSNDEAGRLSATFNDLRTRFASEMREYARTREELKIVDEEKSHFLAIVSHELRTPLNTIVGFSQLLIDGIEGDMPESQLEDVRIIQMSGRNLLGLINDILDLSAIESGTIQIEPGEVNVGALLLEIHTEFEGQLRGKRTKLHVHVPDTALVAWADRKRVYQVINNLVSNAVKFTPRGLVTIEGRATDGRVEVSVRDNGPGIPSDDLETIFSEFKQSGTSSMKSRGTGLGLAICKKLVDLQGGTIGVTSVEGQGSTFTFDIPAQPPEENGEAAS